ncbi:MAG: hypothetical protein NTW21_15180 [Verrucomicrobia bacterium]|nr:hypothetical protein [Verrucomicrobiota bacterium]
MRAATVATASPTNTGATGTLTFPGLTSIGTLSIQYQKLMTGLDLTGLTSAVNFQSVVGFIAFNFGSASVTNLTLYSCASLMSLTVPPGNISCLISYCGALASLTVGSQPSCTYFNLYSCGSIATLNLTGIATAMYNFAVSYCGMLTTGLTIKTGTVMQNSYAYLDMRSNSLTTTCINAIFTALGTTALSPTIQMDGNPGEATSNKGIATAKG